MYSMFPYVFLFTQNNGVFLYFYFLKKLKNDELIAAKEFTKKSKHFKKYDVIDFSLHEV